MNKQKSKINKKMAFGAFSLVSVCVLSFSVNARTLVFQSSGNSQPTNSSSSAATQDQAPVYSEPLINNPAAAVINPDVSASANNELFFMLEQLQQEVNTLRGIIEEQGHELRVLKQNSRDRYVDLDSRVLDLTKRVSGNVNNAATVSGAVSAGASTVSGGAAPGSSAVSGTAANNKKQGTVAATPIQSNELTASTQREPTKAENDAYNAAYAFIKEKKFDDAILALFSYTESFPDSPLLPNVYYWLGEVYLATSKLEQAKTSFSLVMTAYPDNPKVSDALYKLAVTLDRLGEKAQAKQYLSEVRKKYPNTSAAKLAESYTLTP